MLPVLISMIPNSTGGWPASIFGIMIAVATLDTLSVTKRLRAAGFSEDQAEAVTDIVREASRIDTSSLVTKADLKAELADTKAEILKWMFGTIGLQTVVVLGALVALLRMGVR